MAIDFPNSPSNNDQYTVGTTTWMYNGTAWVVSLGDASIATGAITADKIAASAVTSAKIAASPSLTGIPLAPTAAGGTNTTQIATTAYVDAAVSVGIATVNTLDELSDVTITTTDTYAIGDTGPGGGKIFITPSTAGNSTGKYFEVAPSSAQVARTWATNVSSNQTTAVSGADGTAIGTGAQNTIDIVAQAGNVAATSAAVYASDYTNGGFSDWFLPSKNELNELYTQIAVLSSPQNTYWSSTEDSATTAWYQDFFGGGQYADLKMYGSPPPVATYVRPVRSFTAAANPVAVSGQALTWNGAAWVNSTLAAAPKTYVTKYTTNGAGTWTCPAGVTQIKLTLIGAGGACGDVEAITAFASTSAGFSGNTAGSTTFVVGGTTHTALGGKKGANVSVTGDIFEMTVSIASASSTSGVDDADYNRYPGCGGAPSTASAYTQRTWLDGDVYALHRSRAYAHGKRGQDGVTQVFQVTVVPSTVYSFTVGAAAGYDGITTYSTQGSNGAVIIEYVV